MHLNTFDCGLKSFFYFLLCKQEVNIIYIHYHKFIDADLSRTLDGRHRGDCNYKTTCRAGRGTWPNGDGDTKPPRISYVDVEGARPSPLPLVELISIACQ